MPIPGQEFRGISLRKGMLRNLLGRYLKSKVTQDKWMKGIFFRNFSHYLSSLIGKSSHLVASLDLKLAAPSTQNFVLGLFLSTSAYGHPEFQVGWNFPALGSFPRATITVIYNVGTAEKPRFKMAFPAIVPSTRDGKLLWFEDEGWRQFTFQGSDRILVEKDMLGSDVKGAYQFKGCTPSEGYRFSTPQGIAWLASCSSDVTKSINNSGYRVSYDAASTQINSRFYNYKFKKNNHMLFDAVTLKGDREFVVSKDSHLYIRSDVKNFFTLDFSSDDIQSELKRKRFDPLAAFASLSFYLRVLFFKITLDLTTDVGFFESSANIPMVMTLPLNAYDRLHRKSGVLYNFRLGEGVDPKSIKVTMPTLKAQDISDNFEAIGLKYCSDRCIYEIEVATPMKPLRMRITIARSLVERGLFPWFVDDVSRHKGEMKWDLSDHKGRVGLYFEVSKLPKGSHPWDFWLTF